MGSKFSFTLGFVISFHLIKRIADECAKGLELPATLGAAEALKILGPNPFQCALHCCIITAAVSKTEQPLQSLPDFNPKLWRTPDDRGVKPRPPRKSVSGGARFTLMEE